MSYVRILSGDKVITLYFTNREPINIWSGDEAMRLAVELCKAIYRAFPDESQT